MNALSFLDSILIRMNNSIPMFNIGELLTNLIKKAKNYGGGLIIVIGIIMIVVAGFKIGKGLMTQGKPNAQPINWFLCGGLLLVGCVFAFGGFTSLSNISKSVGETVDDLTGDDKNTFSGDKDNAGDGIDDENKQFY